MGSQTYPFASQSTEYALAIVEEASLISLGCLTEPLEYVKQNHFPNSKHVPSVVLRLSPKSPGAGLGVESAGHLEELITRVQSRLNPTRFSCI